MNSKIIFAALAITFGTTFVAHADEYRRPVPKPQPQYQDYDDQDDLEEQAPHYRECEEERCERRPRVKYLCNTECPQPRLLPYPYPQPNIVQVPVPVPVPVPHFYPVQPRGPLPHYGPCEPRPTPGGWVIVTKTGVVVASGPRAAAPQIPITALRLIQNRICSYVQGYRF